MTFVASGSPTCPAVSVVMRNCTTSTPCCSASESSSSGLTPVSVIMTWAVLSAGKV